MIELPVAAPPRPLSETHAKIGHTLFIGRCVKCDQEAVHITHSPNAPRWHEGEVFIVCSRCHARQHLESFGRGMGYYDDEERLKHEQGIFSQLDEIVLGLRKATSSASLPEFTTQN